MMGRGKKRGGKEREENLGCGRKPAVGAASPEHPLQEPVLTQDSPGMIVQWWEGWR